MKELIKRLISWRNLIVKSSISYNWDMFDEQALNQIKQLISQSQERQADFFSIFKLSFLYEKLNATPAVEIKKQIMEKIIKELRMIDKFQERQMDEEFIQRKARELAELFRDPNRVKLHKAIINTEYFIRSIIQEIQKSKEEE